MSVASRSHWHLVCVSFRVGVRICFFARVCVRVSVPVPVYVSVPVYVRVGVHVGVHVGVSVVKIKKRREFSLAARVRFVIFPCSRIYNRYYI